MTKRASFVNGREKGESVRRGIRFKELFRSKKVPTLFLTTLSDSERSGTSIAAAVRCSVWIGLSCNLSITSCSIIKKIKQTRLDNMFHLFGSSTPVKFEIKASVIEFRSPSVGPHRRNVQID